MKLSIITPTYNHAQFIVDTIESVLRQKDCEVEHIVIDGGSKDGTVEILKKYPHLKWVSEKDGGQTNAINKGFSMATGDVLAWLNSDDYYFEDCLHHVVEYFSANPDCNFLYGNISFVDVQKSHLRTFKGAVMGYQELLINPDVVRQPSCFWRKRALTEIGQLNEGLNLVMDFEFFLRLSKKFRMHYLDVDFSCFRFYTQSKSNKFMLEQLNELKGVYLAHAPESINLYRKFRWARRMQGLKSKIRSLFRNR